VNELNDDDDSRFTRYSWVTPRSKNRA